MTMLRKEFGCTDEWDVKKHPCQNNDYTLVLLMKIMDKKKWISKEFSDGNKL